VAFDRSSPHDRFNHSVLHRRRVFAVCPSESCRQ
jgi:hypothetical protein